MPGYLEQTPISPIEDYYENVCMCVYFFSGDNFAFLSQQQET